MRTHLSATSRRRGLTSLALCGVLALTGCASDSDDSSDGSSESASNETKTIEGDFGPVEIPADPQRIVTLNNVTPLALELGVQPVGVSTWADAAWYSDEQQAMYDKATEIDAAQLDYELILSLEPDLIVVLAPTKYNEQEHSSGQLDDIAPTVYVSFQEDWEATTKTVAEALNKTDEFEASKTDYEAAVADFTDKYQSQISGSSAISVNRYANTDAGSFVVEKAIFACNNFVADLGFEQPPFGGKEMTAGTEPVALEKLSDLDTYDYVLYPLTPDGEPKPEMAPVLESNNWQSLSVVTSGHALGTKCRGVNSYASGEFYIESLDEAFAEVPAS